MTAPTLDPQKAPPRGLTAACDVYRVIDGDTVEIELRIPMRVRLLDCWAPETRTKDADEKKRGLASREHLAGIAEGSVGTVFIPWEHASRMGDVLSFGRALAHVWVNDKSLSEEQVKAGHATETKETP